MGSTAALTWVKAGRCSGGPCGAAATDMGGAPGERKGAGARSKCGFSLGSGSRPGPYEAGSSARSKPERRSSSESRLRA